MLHGALADVAPLVGAASHNQKVASLIPGQSMYGQQPTDASLSHIDVSFPPFLSL